MIWLCVVLYFMIGDAVLLVGQVLNQKGYDRLGFFDPEDDKVVFSIIAMAVVLCWPVYVIFYIMALFIPWIIISGYKVFVGIIFGTIALFKKEKGQDGLE